MKINVTLDQAATKVRKINIIHIRRYLQSLQTQENHILIYTKIAQK
jgi:hypothetical protein